ncbi:hypothetical protein [Hansschlegelia zhihuaiae]|uniref:Uncharacterized protein n=1 Tax=Hansschlegelia zhihuaiae TaxID=405005 RepID=A0A4Q0MNA4_9HYPH|nr:hypothetical protein [Hansschlegelia zhihuaiae]RXF75341.1 hypothetical protein EK403_00280 [Hansschlegelia zhihuaiae]
MRTTLEGGGDTAMHWGRLSADFEFDGSWRDIYVLDAALPDWSKVWNCLFDLNPRPALNSADYSGPMPKSFDWAGQLAGGRAHLGVAFGKITFNCHFFDESQIEFDLDPRFVNSLAEAEDIARFMTLLGEATGKAVISTWENCQDAVIARYDPVSTEVTWLPVVGPSAKLPSSE